MNEIIQGDCKHIVGFSGGAASSVCAKIVAERFLDLTVLLFHDTKTEPDDNYRFRREVAEHIGLAITDFSDGRDIWQLFRDNKMIANDRIDFCSRILKREMSLKYLKANQPCVLYLGFTVEERERSERSFLRYETLGIEVQFPLVELGITKEECYHRIETCWGIRLPQVYKWADHANCIPCIRGKLAYWGCIYMFEREAWERMNVMEKEFGNTVMGQGSLEELLPKCLELAEKYLAKKEAGKSQGILFDMPCECSI